MKKLLIISLIAFSLYNCSDNVVGDFEPIVDRPEGIPGVNKKGVCYSNFANRWSHRASAMKAHWMYSWGTVMRPEIPDNVEFVPMFWGASSVITTSINRVKGYIDEGKVKFVMGFNEPDSNLQANMTVAQAIALWPQLEALGVPLVSPTTVNPLNTWMKSFMEQAESLNYRVDYIGVHYYGAVNPAVFVNQLKQTYALYKKPLWVKEFAVADWNASIPANNRWSRDQVANFMKEAIKALDEIDYVYRYSWFDGRDAPLHTSALFFDNNSDLTPAGQIYANNHPNNIIGEGVDTEIVIPFDPNELIVNGSFETGSVTPWGHYNQGVASSDVTPPHFGNYSGRISQGDGTLRQDVPVTPGQQYVLKAWYKWNTMPAAGFSASLRNATSNALIATMPALTPTTEWTLLQHQFTVPAGVTQLRVQFYKGSGPVFFLDSVSLKLAD